MREKFYRFIIRKLFKIPFCEVPPKWCIILRWIMFPLRTYLVTNNYFRYDVMRDCFIILGERISSDSLFRLIRDTKRGDKFLVYKEEDSIILKRINDK